MYNVFMNEVKFSWDQAKAESNKQKHKIAFEEATSVFYDPKAIRLDDPDHSEREQRFLIIGMSWSLKILIVSHCYRESEEEIRIINARKATKKEKNTYTRGLR